VNTAFDFFNDKPSELNIESNQPIDIIIPIYNGYEYLEVLFNSLVRNTRTSYRLIIINDCSTDLRVNEHIQKFSLANPKLKIVSLQNEHNLGFVKSVNKAVLHTQNHFVLLNSDVEVPPDWLERLMYPIFNMDRVASTTPFTNSGTICSFPNYLQDNPIFEGLSVEEIDHYFKYVNAELTNIEIPTGVGFCMGINKELVNEIGMFDETFGKGYGEENDWCQRAIINGYKNLHVTNLFVYHKHGGSFQNEEKKRLIEFNSKILSNKHPTYNSQVSFLVSKNELQNLRDQLKNLILSDKYKAEDSFNTIKNGIRFLLISHQLDFSGAPIALYQMAKALRKLGHKVYLVSLAEGPLANSFLEIGVIPFSESIPFDICIANTVLSVPLAIHLNPDAKKIFAWIHEANYFFDIMGITPNALSIDKLKYVGFPSKFQIDEFAKFIPNGSLMQFKNWVETPFGFSQDAIRYYVVSGSWETRKNQIKLIELLRFFNISDKILFLGASRPEIAFENNLIFLGNVDPLESKKIIANSSGLISCSLSETQNLAAIEAMLSGVPVLLSSIAVHQELKECMPEVLLFDLHTPTSFHDGFKMLPTVRADVSLSLKLKKNALDNFGEAQFLKSINSLISLFKLY